MVQYDLNKVYVRETKQDVLKKTQTQIPPIWQIQRSPRSQGQIY